MEFSEEFVFFFKNWDNIEKFLSAERSFRKEFTNILYSLENILKDRPWWNENLVFIKLGSTQIYISRNDWKYNDKDYAIWIGIENYTPERLLGTDTPANYFLYTTGNNKEKIINDLSQIIQKEENLREYLASTGQYVIKRYLRTYTKEEYEDFISGVQLREMADFIEKIYLAIEDYKF